MHFEKNGRRGAGRVRYKKFLKQLMTGVSWFNLLRNSIAMHFSTDNYADSLSEGSFWKRLPMRPILDRSTNGNAWQRDMIKRASHAWKPKIDGSTGRLKMR